MLVREFMKTEFKTVSEAMSVSELASLFIIEREEGYPVVNNHMEIVGFVTVRDLLQVFLPNYIRNISDFFDYSDNFGYLEIFYMRGKGSFFIVEDIMNYNVISIDEDSSLTKALVIMFLNKISVLPVLKGFKILGVIRLRDIISVLFEGS
ncbi:MAG TPA: CBS domain-containing protein [Candidatus Wallbacteria bacterium]|nr:CBS domain-containing protein [Candidatus Wallbacteria bacterium]